MARMLRSLISMSFAASIALPVGFADASDPAAVRARPLGVRYGTGSPISVNIDGMFAFYDELRSLHLAPRCGTLSFFCRGSREDLCRMEWADMAKAAADGTCVSFGARFWSNPANAVKPLGNTSADHPYDPNMGVVVIPCRPEPPSAERPDLTGACGTPSPDGGADAGGPLVDAGAADGPPAPPEAPVDAASSPPDALAKDAAPVDAPAIDARATDASTVDAPAVEAPVATPPPPSMPRGCAAGGVPRAGAANGLAVLAFAAVLCTRARRTRRKTQRGKTGSS